MSSSASTVAPPMAPPPSMSVWVICVQPESDAVAGGEGLDVARQVPGARHLEEGDGGTRPVVVRGVERIERVRLRQLDGIERAATDRADVGRTRARLWRGLPQGHAGAAANEPPCGPAGLAWGTIVDGLGGLSVFSPRIPWICGATVDGYLRGRLVVVPRLPRSQVVALDRRREGGLDLRHGARDGQRQPGRRRRPHRQTLVAERSGDLCDGARRRSEALRELCRRQEMAVLRRVRVGDRAHLRHQRGGIAREERDHERQRGRRRSRADQRRAGRNSALMPGQRFLAGLGSERLRRAGSAERHHGGHRQGRAEEPARHAVRPAAALSLDPCLHVAHRSPPGDRLMPPKEGP